MQGAAGAIRSGGDARRRRRGHPAGAGAARALSPASSRSAPDGTAKVAFDLPAFNGTVRVMAVAWAKTKVGSVATDVIVRDPVVVDRRRCRASSIVGDQSRFYIDVDNVEGPAGDYTVDVDVHGPLVLPADASRTTFGSMRAPRGRLTIPVTAAGVGHRPSST